MQMDDAVSGMKGRFRAALRGAFHRLIAALRYHIAGWFVVRTNLRGFTRKAIVRELLRESMGGNAGRDYAAVNLATTRWGRIVGVGNFQHLPVKIRAGLERGRLLHWTVRVRTRGYTSTYELEPAHERRPLTRAVVDRTIGALNVRS